MFDPRNDKVWTDGVDDSRQLTEGPLRTGSKVEHIYRLLCCLKMGFVYEVTATDGESLVEMTLTESFPESIPASFATRIRYQLEPTAGGTLTSIHVRTDTTGFSKLVMLITTPLARRSLTKNLLLLKKTLERAGK